MASVSYYVAVKASPYSVDCTVFGLSQEEVKALETKFSTTSGVLNGIILKEIIIMSECTHSHGAVTSSVFQSLDELDFERGIWSAALKGDTERIEKLLKKHTDVDQLDGAGYTALHYASRSGHVDSVRCLLAHGANVNAKTKAGGATPLLRAAGAGHLPVVQLLMKKGAKVQLVDGDGQTALHRAALGGHTDVLQFLVSDQTLDLLTVKDVRGRTVLNCACGQPNTIEFLKRLSESK